MNSSNVLNVGSAGPKVSSTDYAAYSNNLQQLLKDRLPEETSENINTSVVQAILCNEEVRNVFASSVLQKSHDRTVAQKNLRTIHVTQRLCRDDEICLSSMFYMFNLDFHQATDEGSHAFYRAARRLAMEKIYLELNVSPTSRPGKNYDCVLKDVGGNPTVHVNRGEQFVHSCCPTLSTNDDRRKSAYRFALSKFRPTVNTFEAYRLHCSGSSSVICHRMSQFCRVKAPALMFLHSSYDMTLEDMALAMLQSNAIIAKGVFLFSPKILTTDEGPLGRGLNFRKFKIRHRDGTIVPRIRFWFDRDMQQTYEHDLVNYLRILTKFRVTVRVSGIDHHFTLEHEGPVGNHIFFTIHRSVSGSVPRDHPSMIITDQSLEDKLIVYYWRWETLNPGTFFDKITDHMKPVRMVVPKKLFFRMVSYADTLSDTKFNVKNILIAATAFNSREIISGQSVGIPEPVEADVLKMLAHAVFFLVYVSNYENSKCLSTLMADEAKVRSLSGSSYFSRWFSNGCKRVWNSFINRHDHRLLDGVRAELVEEVTPESHLYEAVLKRMFEAGERTVGPADRSDESRAAVFREFQVLLRKNSCQFITVEEELAAITCSPIQYDRLIDNESIADSLFPAEQVRKIVMDSLEACADLSDVYSERDFRETSCRSDLRLVQNQSRGHCLYAALRDLGVTSDSPTEIRQNLLNSKHLNNISKSEQLRKQLSVNDGSEAGFTDTSTYLLVALHYDLRLCVHHAGITKIFGREEAPLCHIDVNNGHCQALLPNNVYAPVDEYVFDANLNVLENYDFAPMQSLFKNFFDLRRGMGRNTFNKDLKTARANYYPYSSLRSCGYVCRSPLKTHEILTRYVDHPIESAVSMGGPGGEVQYLTLKHQARVFGVTLTTPPGIDFDAVVSYQNSFTQLFGATGNGDITKGDNVLAFTREILSEYPHGIDFFGGDAAIGDEYERKIGSGDPNDLVYWQLLFATSVLREGGSAYFKVFDAAAVSDSFPGLHAPSFLPHFFSEVRLVKLQLSYSASTEMHFVCTGFSSNPDVRSQLLARTPIADHIFLHQCRYAMSQIFLSVRDAFAQYVRCFRSLSTPKPLRVRMDSEILDRIRAELSIETVQRPTGGLDSAVRILTSMANYIRGSGTDWVLELSRLAAVPVVEEIPAPASFEDDSESSSGDDGDIPPTPIEHLGEVIAADECIEATEQSFALSLEVFNSSHANSARIRSEIVTAVGAGLRAVVKPVVSVLSDYRVVQPDYNPVFDGSYTVIGQNVPTGITPLDVVGSALPPYVRPLRPRAMPSDNLPLTCSSPPLPENSEDPHEDHREAMREYLELLQFTLTSEISNHSRILEIGTNHPTTGKYFQNQSGGFSLCRANDRDKNGYEFVARNPAALPKYNRFFVIKDGEGVFLEFEKIRSLEVGTMFLLSEYSSLALEIDTIERLRHVEIDSVQFPEMTITQAPPGAGKTHYILERAVPPNKANASNVLLSTREGRDDFVARSQRKHGVEYTAVELHRVRTLASFLINHEKNHVSSELFIDEALMSHPGSLFFAVALSGATTVKMLGDVLQIPYVNRTPAFKVRHSSLSAMVPIGDVLHVSRRCPVDVAWRLSPMYAAENKKAGKDLGMMSTNVNFDSCKVVRITSNRVHNESDVKNLVFTHADKAILESKGIESSTVHEFQGKENDHIRVYRFDTNAQSDIFLRTNYALVALTRHRKSLIYYTRVTSDALSRLIKQSPTRDQCMPLIYNAPTGVYSEAAFTRYADPTSFKTLRTTVTPLNRIESDRVYFVSRTALDLVGGERFGNHVVRRRRGYSDDWFVVCTDTGRANLRTMRTSLGVFNLARISTDVVWFSGCVLEELDHTMLALTLYKFCPRFRFIACTSRRAFEAPVEVFQLMNVNGNNEMGPDQIVKFDVETCVPTAPSLDAPVAFDIRFAQKFIDRCFGSIGFVDQRFDAWMVSTYDLVLELGVVRFSSIAAPVKSAFYDCLSPVLKTPVPMDRDYTRREVMLAFDKRNRSVPEMCGTVDVAACATEMCEKFFARCVNKSIFSRVNTSPVVVSAGTVTEWLRGQDVSVIDQMVPEFALHLSAVNEYNFSIKRKPKPNLTIDAVSSYLALQTIVYHEKPINAMFCSIFREMKARLLASLLPHVFVYTDVSVSDFEKALNEKVPPGSLDLLCKKLEIDISKYDKSQGWLALEYECALMCRFGVPRDMVKLWYDAHVLTQVYDKSSKMRALVPYQRKSGDASTFLGNTLFLMAVISDLVPVDQLKLALFSGDDSLLVGHNLEQYHDSQHFGLKFNLEMKFLSYPHSYFCSKFLLNVSGRWSFTPDPLKLFVKIGRANLVNDQHVEEYRVSMLDNCVNFRDPRICAVLADAVAERYGILGDFSALFRSVPDMMRPDVFPTLWFVEPGAVIDRNRYAFTSEN